MQRERPPADPHPGPSLCAAGGLAGMDPGNERTKMTILEFFARNPNPQRDVVEWALTLESMDDVWKKACPTVVFWIAMQPGVLDQGTLDAALLDACKLDLPPAQAAALVNGMPEASQRIIFERMGRWLRANAKPNFA